jgi:DNA-binding transcriptional regulator LsrR (DeoR family)
MPYSKDLMYKIAILYYKDRLKQESVARRLKISKYKVNRVLKSARKEGIIEINIRDPQI